MRSVTYDVHYRNRRTVRTVEPFTDLGQAWDFADQKGSAVIKVVRTVRETINHIGEDRLTWLSDRKAVPGRWT